jgi:ClpP class serine protease
VNASADVFFKDIAASRGLDKAKLQKNLGDGRTVLAREALQNRLIDKVGSLSDAIKIAQVEAARKSKRR